MLPINCTLVTTVSVNFGNVELKQCCRFFHFSFSSIAELCVGNQMGQKPGKDHSGCVTLCAIQSKKVLDFFFVVENFHSFA